MKRILILTLTVVCLLLVGCSDTSIGVIGGADGPTSVIVGENSEDEWGLYLCAENVTNKGVTIKFEHIGKNAEGELETGAAYSIETNVNGEWKPVKAKVDNPVWNSIAYMIKKNDTTELEINWDFLYGELLPGSYRISKEIMNFKAPGEYDEKIYYAYFVIE